MDIDGEFTPKKHVSAADRMKILRAKLEERNEILVRKKIEQARMKSELELMRKLQRSFDESMKRVQAIN